MKSKKAQSLPMNTIIIAIIAIVVLVIIIVFFIGGTSSIAQKIRELFTGATSGTDLQTAKQFCQEYCDQERTTAWCNKYFRIDTDANGIAEKVDNSVITSPYKKFYCGTPNLATPGNDVDTTTIGIACPTITCQ